MLLHFFCQLYFIGERKMNLNVRDEKEDVFDWDDWMKQHHVKILSEKDTEGSHDDVKAEPVSCRKG